MFVCSLRVSMACLSDFSCSPPWLSTRTANLDRNFIGSGGYSGFNFTQIRTFLVKILESTTD
ncbi:unnamed protein product [Acanthoscelides obtectus]|uniref:Uncharacterized protein n=1 Tax=Acanthoscelides obtectus TaxID=200917 RepID=A0A9P0JX15_ACAOB|nr:unnamed protein product [Acanthoscelides obtectus]CAK1633938.1 hypothetical protein AOBTE_LOCUS8493 [Acanthoscelides obtectus]